ncbi:MAG: hypothetical protein OEL76_12790 [Siculibacillus sp.]|nr:hypothetical protein [Siculibacillus sp.]
MRSAKRTPQRPSPRDTSFGPALATVESLRERLFAVVPSAAIVTLATREAVGAVVASDLVVPRDEPATAISLLCGHAVASVETIGASPYAPVDLVTGHRVEPGTPIEPPCDAVLAADAVIAIAGGRQVQESVAPGENLLRAGASAAAGTPIVTAGTRFSSGAALYAEAGGVEAVAVRRARVGVLHDGSRAGAVAARALATLVGTGQAKVDVATFATEDRGEADLVLLIGRGDLSARDPALDHLRAHGRVDGGGLALAAWISATRAERAHAAKGE